MANKSNRVANHSRQPSHDETKLAIAMQTERFLNLGGVVQQIPIGVSGQIWKPVKSNPTAKS